MAVTAHDDGNSHDSKRILACVLCQQRKKKCDRKPPCSVCTKANVKCVPSTPAPKRKRRSCNKELMARVERLEQLLKKCTCVQKAAAMYDDHPAIDDDNDSRASSCSSTETGTASSSSPSEYDKEASSVR